MNGSGFKFCVLIILCSGTPVRLTATPITNGMPFETPEESDYDGQPSRTLLIRMRRKSPGEFVQMVEKYHDQLIVADYEDILQLFCSYLKHMKETVSAMRMKMCQWGLRELYRFLCEERLQCHEVANE